MAGYVKIHRAILDSPCGSRGAVYLGAMVWLVMRARYADGYEKGVELKRGQLFVGRHEMAVLLDISEMSVRCLLAKLEQNGFITRKTTNRGTIITVCNYELYQGSETEEQPTGNQHPAGNQPTISQPTTTNNKERKKELIYTPTHAQAGAREEVPAELAPEEAREWERWMVLYENEFGKPMHQLQREQQLAKLILLPAELRLEALRNSCGFNGKVKPAIYDPRPPAEAVRTFQPADQRQAAPLSLEEQEKLAEGFIE